MEWKVRIGRSRKGQSALEFLLTYGWAILVVLAAIIALATFGVLNPAKFFPEACTLSSTSGLGCIDFKIQPNAAYLLIMNGRGMDMHIKNVSIGSCGAEFNVDLVDGQHHLFNLTGCSFGSKGVKMKQDILLYYNYQASNLTKAGTGSVSAVIS